GPPIRHWCMRFESKHRYFKQLATKSNNFKNIIFSLSKRHQLHQCFLFSSWNYFQANEQFSSPKQVKLKGLSAAVRQLLHDNIEDFDYATHISECQQQAHDHVKIMKGSVFVDTISHEEEVPSFMQLAFIFKINNKWVLIVEQLQTIAFVETLWSFELERTSEDIDGDTLFNLPQSMIFEIVTKLKERVRFLTEHRALFNGSYKNNIEKTSSDIQSNDFNDNNVQQTVQETFTNQYTTLSNVAYLNEGQYDLSAYDSSINNIDIDEETVGSKQDTNDTEKENKVESKFSDVYILPDLPNKIRQLISTQEIKHFRNHTNSRRLLLDVIFADVTEKYSLLYPNAKQYKSIATAILKELNITNSDRASSEWIEGLKGKFKGERRLLQEISEQVQKMKQKQKHGNVIGRPLKQNVNEVAARREVCANYLYNGEMT
ncbi:unnamed protein product, partial [Rotaria magnacalcarata]